MGKRTVKLTNRANPAESRRVVIKSIGSPPKSRDIPFFDANGPLGMENYRVFSETFHYDRAIEQIPSLASVLNVWGRLKAVPIIEEQRIPGTDRWEQVENSRAVAQLNRPNNYQTGSQFIADLITAFILRGEYRILKINSDGQLTTDN